MKPISIGRYLGGKVRLARAILPWLSQPTNLYIEPMAGLFTLGLNLYHAPQRVAVELNPRTYNLLLMVRDRAPELIKAINNSPRDRTSLEDCWLESDDPLEDARRYYWVTVSTFTGGGTRWATGVTEQRAKRCLSHRADHLWAASDRLRGVEILHGDGLHCASTLDRPGALHYFDPTYVNAVRGAKDNRHANTEASLTRNQYQFETDQEALLTTVAALRGAVVVSGYPNKPYGALEDEGWQIVDITSRDAARNVKVERLWFNPVAWNRLPYHQMELISC